MQSDFLDRKLYKMAEQEQMAVSEDLDARVDDILQHLEKNGRGSRHPYRFRPRSGCCRTRRSSSYRP